MPYDKSVTITINLNLFADAIIDDKAREQRLQI